MACRNVARPGPLDQSSPRNRLTAAIGIVSLAVLFHWRISNPVLIAATAVLGLIA
jgi:hypothetical protein